ncbi:MAG: class I SAM-dependent methyltransferase [Ignavibacteria bacterium]|nr:class I SAM-dependent methyltransferase [Ignavibacteria bacterium]
MLKKLFDNTSKNSLANKFRRKRFRIFLELIESIPKPVKILDIGGTENFWIQMGLTDPKAAKITIVNIDEPDGGKMQDLPNMEFIKGDARDENLYKAGEFDIIFSNSVIEHINDESGQGLMAKLIRTYGRKYFVQTPARSIPIEPHFLFPYFQFLPRSIKLFLVMHFNMGWFKKCNSKEEAVELVGSIRLLNKNQMQQFFADAEILTERFLRIPKSYIAIKK